MVLIMLILNYWVYPRRHRVGPGVPLRVRRPLPPHLEGVVVLARRRVVQRGVVEVAAEVVLKDARVFVELIPVEVGVLREMGRGRGTAKRKFNISYFSYSADEKYLFKGCMTLHRIAHI